MRLLGILALLFILAETSLLAAASGRRERAAIWIHLDRTERSGQAGAESVIGFFRVENNLVVPLTIDGDIDPADNLFMPHPAVYGLQSKPRDANDEAWTDVNIYPAGNYPPPTTKLTLAPVNPVSFKALLFGPAQAQMDFKNLIFRLKMRIAGAPTPDTFSEEFFFVPQDEASPM